MAMVMVCSYSQCEVFAAITTRLNDDDDYDDDGDGGGDEERRWHPYKTEDTYDVSKHSVTRVRKIWSNMKKSKVQKFSI